MKKINIVGVKFNNLTVLRQEGSYKNGEKLYLCQCDCGNPKLHQTSSKNLRRGNVKSCGCLTKQKFLNRKDLAGERFGKLVVISQHCMTKHGIEWLCNCDCGKTVILHSDKLRKIKGPRSCGCLSDETIKITNEKLAKRDPWQFELNACKSCAIYRKIEFKLSVDQYKNLVLNNCYYCDAIPQKNPTASGLKRKNIFVNGIDRINSNLGYLLENCVSCCTNCNTAKMSLTYDEFLENTKKRFLFLLKKQLVKLD